ncbi:AAA family ATPase [Lactococcus hircilactis]|uniref:Shikimate kinase n=1 Tax=Lactococcus hircilactis TaxID=1494462 RepID=A0A7X1Z8T7_9LACT|nr:shikimate kinase [Lactococcus hircilactis]MQW39379.1 AAA family ATPase [Lactococcus hircilactis]
MSVILIGFMGAGKSTVAKALSADYIDLDRVIERQIQRSIASYFEEFGEAQFRVLEGEVLAEQLKKNLPIATGGGIVERIENRKLLKQHMQVVYLKADFSVLFDRILNDATHVRPLAKNGEAVLKARYLAREKYYETLANLVINVNQKTPEEIARHIREWQKEGEI